MLPELTRGQQRARAAARVLQDGQRDLPRTAGAFCRYGFSLLSLTWAADGLPTLPSSPRLREAHSYAPRGAILFLVMADGTWRGIVLFMLVHFAATKRTVARLFSRVLLRAGTGRSKICINPGYVRTGRGPYIHWQKPVPDKSRRWISRQQRAGLAEKGQGVNIG